MHRGQTSVNLEFIEKDDDTSADGDIRQTKEELIKSLSKRPGVEIKTVPRVFQMHDADAHKQKFLEKFGQRIELETEHIHDAQFFNQYIVLVSSSACP